MGFPSEFVSVVVPVFNGAHFLAQAIESVRRQVSVPTEIIIVDDGSTDESREIARAIREVRLLHQPHQGAAAARNAGITHSRGHYLAFLDADDLWPQNKLAMQMEVMREATHVQIVAGRVEEFAERPGAVESARIERRSGLRAYTIGAMLIRREDFLKVGLLNPSLQFGEFMDWHSRAMALGFKEQILREVVLKRRLHERNSTRSAGDRQRDYLKALKMHLDRKRSSGISAFPRQEDPP